MGRSGAGRGHRFGTGEGNGPHQATGAVMADGQGALDAVRSCLDVARRAETLGRRNHVGGTPRWEQDESANRGAARVRLFGREGEV